jgi:hypothetical protein
MKRIKFSLRFLLLLLMVSLVVWTSSCTKDEEAAPPKTIEEHRQELTQFATSEKAMVDSTVIGYNKKNFMVASTSKFASQKAAYLKVLDTALSLVKKPVITMKNITDTYKSFGVPGQAFQFSLFISDRRPLNDLVVPCEALNAATTVGTATGQVSQEAKTAFTNSITAAKKTRDLSATIDRQVADGVTVLQKAKTDFEAAIIK